MTILNKNQLNEVCGLKFMLLHDKSFLWNVCKKIEAKCQYEGSTKLLFVAAGVIDTSRSVADIRTVNHADEKVLSVPKNIGR